MKTLKIQIPIIAILVATVVSSCSNTEANDKENSIGAEENNAVPIKVMKIQKEKINRTLPFTANLKAFEQVDYAPASPGHIKEVYVDVDSRVAKGDLIALMDNTQLHTAEIQLDNAESNYRRLDTLYTLNSISEQQYESAKNGYEMALANVNFMKENTRLTSPINGVITHKYYEGGELYSGMPNTAAGKAAIVTIMQINPLKAIIDVPEKYFPMLEKGMIASITSDIYKDKMFEGKVYRVSPVINENSRSFEVELVINNENEKLRPGMFARVNLNIGNVEAMVVPAITILKEDGTNQRFIYTLDKNNKAKRINVEIVNRFDDKIEINTNELNEGDLIVIAGQEKLSEGAKVNIIK